MENNPGLKDSIARLFFGSSTKREAIEVGNLYTFVNLSSKSSFSFASFVLREFRAFVQAKTGFYFEDKLEVQIETSLIKTKPFFMLKMSKY